MKRFNLLLIFTTVLFWSMVLSGQDYNDANCGTTITNEQYEKLKQKRAQFKFYEEEYFRKKQRKSSSSNAVTSIPIKAHIIRTSAGTGGLSEADLNAAMVILNDFYANAFMEFFLCDGINYIDSDDYYDYETNDETVMTDTHNVSNLINIYFTNSIESSSNPGSFFCGYAYFPGGPDVILMDNSCTMNGSTFPHELGHFFSTLHTHGPSNGTLTTELVNGSNCSSDGDLLCDTPADPQLGFLNVTSDCNYDGTAPYTSGGGIDSNGDAFNPDPNNIMSYSRKECRTIFSADQYARIYASFQIQRNYFSCPSLNVDFTASKTFTCQNSLTVSFTDNSNGATSWEWDFNGDGIIDSNAPNPTYTYSSAGVYGVSLSISDGTQTISRNKMNYINVGINVNLPVNENFDTIFTATDINWTSNDLSGNGFNWIIQGGSTPSSGTGPNTDSSGTGKYIYTESSAPAETGDVAELISNCIEINSNNAQLEFAYHMYGSSMGSLHVDIDSGSGFVSDVTPLISGQQQTNPTDAYLTRQIDLSGYANQTIRIKFRAIRGPSFRSDIAIDDVSITGTLTETYIYNNGWTPSNPVSTPSSIFDDIEVINGTAAISGLLNGNNLAVSSGATLNIDSSSILNLNGDITNNGVIIFKSDKNNTAQLDSFTGTITGSGDVTVERYIPTKRAFRLLSSPVTTTDFIFQNWQENGSTPATPDGLGTHITGGVASLGFDQSGSNNPSMFTFDNATQNWQALANTNNTKLNAQVPYLTMVRGDRTIDLTNNSYPANNTTLRATGELFTGPSSPALATGLGFYSLITNPYQAVVDYSQTTRTDLTDFIYIWDASIGGINGRGGYVTVEVSSNSITNPNPTTSDASTFIAPGMSFFVENVSSGTISPSLTFNESNKDTGASQISVFNTYPHFYINSRLYLSSDYQNGSSERDAIGLRFSEEFTTPGSDEDATKFINPDENFAVVNNGLRSIDKQAVPGLGHEIEFSVSNYTATDYSLAFVMENKPEGLGVFLEDAYLNTQTELTASVVYDFTVDTNIPESIAEDRFNLIFNNTTLSVNENTFGETFSLYPNPTADGLFSIQTPGLSGEVNVEINNLIGQQVYKQELSVQSQQVNLDAKLLSSGVYIVKLHQGKNTFASKLIIR